MPPRPKVLEEDIEEAFLKGSGPGGQKINKTNSAVQLKHVPTGIVIKSQATRSREQNRKIARRLLAEKLEEMEKGDESRLAKLRERDQKKKASKSKKAKRKYKKLELEKGVGAAEDLVEDATEEIDNLRGNTKEVREKEMMSTTGSLLVGTMSLAKDMEERQKKDQERERITASHSVDRRRNPREETES